MLYTCKEDFFRHAAAAKRLSREEEKAFATRMMAGDGEARARIVESYLPVVASIIKRTATEEPSLEVIYRCLDVLEKSVDSFSFLQDNEPFMHTLSNRLRQTLMRYLVDTFTS